MRGKQGRKILDVFVSRPMIRLRAAIKSNASSRSGLAPDTLARAPSVCLHARNPALAGQSQSKVAHTHASPSLRPDHQQIGPRYRRHLGAIFMVVAVAFAGLRPADLVAWCTITFWRAGVLYCSGHAPPLEPEFTPRPIKYPVSIMC
jgi:hypothetical protein